MKACDKKKILVNYTGRNGGGPIDAIEMTKGFLENGHIVSAVISKDVSNIDEWRQLSLEKLVEIKTYDGYVQYLRRTGQFILQEKKVLLHRLGREYDLIYCPMITPWTGIINSLFPNIKKCVVNHDPIPHSSDIKHKLLRLNGIRKVYMKADYIVVHSREFIEYVERTYHKQGRTLYVPLGPQNLKAEKKHDYYDESITNFLFFGRIESYKGVDILIKAYERLQLKRNDVALYVVGNGDLSSCQQVLEQLKNVYVFNRWIGDEEVGDFFRGDKVVLVLPYRDATQSGPAVIALEYGIPTIATNTGGLKEQVKDGKTGILIEPEDVDDLYRAMDRIASDSSLYMDLCKGAEETLEEISWKQSAKYIIEFINNADQD